MDEQSTLAPATPPQANPLPRYDSSLVPALFQGAGEAASYRFIEYFAARIRNPNTRAAYFRAVNRFSAWCVSHQLDLTKISPVVIAGYIEEILGELGRGGLCHSVAWRRSRQAGARSERKSIWNKMWRSVKLAPSIKFA